MTDAELDALTPAAFDDGGKHVPVGATRVLDHGFIRMIRTNCAPAPDADAFIAWCARRSYQDGTEHHRSVPALLRYLLRNGHMSPFEHVVVTFHAFVPLFVQNQWVRHRTGSYSILSLRYSVAPDLFYVPAALRVQHETNKQASGGAIAPTVAGPMLADLAGAHAYARATYEDLIAGGVSRELARGVIPVNVYSDMVVTCDLRNWLHFVGLRYHPHAQPEIQVYAREVMRALEAIAPATVGAWQALRAEGGLACQ